MDGLVVGRVAGSTGYHLKDLRNWRKGRGYHWSVFDMAGIPFSVPDSVLCFVFQCGGQNLD